MSSISEAGYLAWNAPSEIEQRALDAYDAIPWVKHRDPVATAILRLVAAHVDDAACARITWFEALIDRLREFHSPVADETGVVQKCCQNCVAGYDPKTGKLVFCAWPCPTIQVLDGVLGGAP